MKNKTKGEQRGKGPDASNEMTDEELGRGFLDSCEHCHKDAPEGSKCEDCG